MPGGSLDAGVGVPAKILSSQVKRGDLGFQRPLTTSLRRQVVPHNDNNRSLSIFDNLRPHPHPPPEGEGIQSLLPLGEGWR